MTINFENVTFVNQQNIRFTGNMLIFVIRVILVTQLKHVIAWPSGLRRWIKAPVSPGAWVRIPPLSNILFKNWTFSGT